MKNLYRWLLNLNQIISNRIENFGAEYTAFGIFGILNYPLFYIIWFVYNKSGYENLWLRLLATILCLGLLMRNYWPKKVIFWLPLYWYITVLYCLPFFFFYMLFKNHGSSVWLMSANTVIFWLLLVVDWVSYLWILFLGLGLAFLSFIIFSEVNFNFYSWWGVAAQFIASFIIASFFARNKENFYQGKLQTMQSLAASIAHELRTPLATIHTNATGLKGYLPPLIESYKLAKENKLSVTDINVNQLDYLHIAVDDIRAETNYTDTVINMLLMKADQKNINSQNFKLCSISQCVNETLRRYPFSPSEKALVNWQNTCDFQYNGNELLTIHVLFNLLKNALYYIKSANKGDIHIWISNNEKYNCFHFKDTGTGISPQVLHRVFDRFYSNTLHGSGVGLTFCKMVMQAYGGDITCCSHLGEHTEFTLFFPKQI